MLPLDDRTRARAARALERPVGRGAARTLHLLSGHVAGSGRRRRQRARPVVQDPRRRRDHRCRTARASSSPTARASAGTRCSSRTRSCTTSTTSSASRRSRQFVSPELKPGKYTLGMEFTREKAGKYHESIGTTKLYVNDKVVAEGPMRAQVGKFTLCGRRPLRRARQRRRRQPRLQVARHVQGRHHPRRRRHASKRRSTSTSRRWPQRRSRSTSRGSRRSTGGPARAVGQAVCVADELASVMALMVLALGGCQRPCQKRLNVVPGPCGVPVDKLISGSC